MSKPLTVLIGGREALPLYAIPYVTSWNVTPLLLMRELKNKKNEKNGLLAYQIDAPERYVWPEQWEYWEVEFECLAIKDRADNRQGIAHDPSALHIRDALRLPPDVFVWMDDFEKWYSGKLCLTPTIPTEIEENRLKSRLWSSVR